MNPCAWKWPFWVSAVMLALLLAGAGVLFGSDLGLYAFLMQLTTSCEEAVVNRSAAEILPDADWQCALFFGLLLGAFAAAAGSGEFQFDLGCGEESSRSFGSFIRSALAGIFGGACMLAGVLTAGNSIWGEWRAATAGTGGAWLFTVALLLAAGVTGSIWQKLFGALGASGSGKTQSKGKETAAKPVRKAKKGGKK